MKPLPRFDSKPSEPLSAVTRKLRAALDKLAVHLGITEPPRRDLLVDVKLPAMRPPPADLLRKGPR